MDSGSGPGCVFLAQVRNLWSVFASIDADGSGEVDVEEMQAVLMRSRVSGDAALDDSFGSWLDNIDADGDGTISFSEFVAAYPVNK